MNRGEGWGEGELEGPNPLNLSFTSFSPISLFCVIGDCMEEVELIKDDIKETSRKGLKGKDKNINKKNIKPYRKIKTKKKD